MRYDKLPIDITYPPAAHSFLIPQEALSDPAKWIHDNCLLVTKAHYEELERKAAAVTAT